MLSLLAWLCWLLEILFVKGWYSLSWLNGELYSPYFGLLLAAYTFLLPFKFTGIATKKLILPFFLLLIVNAICYEIGKHLCYLMYCRFCFWTTEGIVIIFSLAFLLFPFMGFFYWLIATKLLRKIKKINILYISLFVFGAIVLSNITIYMSTGFGNQTGWVDAVKMGYPVFWMLFALGVSGILVTKKGFVTDEQAAV